MSRSLIAVRRVLIYTHRWLGIAGCALFVVWFLSGIVMMYARMPDLTDQERLEHAAVVDAGRLNVAPSDALTHVKGRARGFRIGMFGGRPVYRFNTARGAAAVFADNGDPVPPLLPTQALDVARSFAPVGATLHSVEWITVPDQWTVSGELRHFFPLHRVALEDATGTELYISAVTGEPVLKTTNAGRTWGYLGAVFHWLYFTPLRRQPAIWSNVVIGLSLAGCVLCLSGLGWGLWRYSGVRRYRLRRERSHTPYAGMMRWHHYAGLVFGLTTFTWTFSGLLSMDPWDWHGGNGATAAQRQAVAGESASLDRLSAAELRAAAGTLIRHTGTAEIEFLQFRGAPYLRAVAQRGGAAATTRSSPPSSSTHLIAIDAPERGTFRRFDDEVMMTAAVAAFPGQTQEDAESLPRYDAYYYDRDGALPLPVLRVRFTDDARTWLYLDPSRGAIVRRETRLTRLNRWLYHGLHSLDFPGLYTARPLWDIVVIVLSIGGIASAATSIWPAWRRIRRLARGLASGRKSQAA
jgi:hypothetical protein